MKTFLLLVLSLSPFSAAAQRPPAAPRPKPTPYVAPALGNMWEILERYQQDRASLLSFFDEPLSPNTAAATGQFYAAWQTALDRLDFNSLDLESRIDYLLFHNRLRREIEQIEMTRRRGEEMQTLLPFAPNIVALKDARQRVDPLDPQAAAATLVQIDKQTGELIKWAGGAKTGNVKPATGARAARAISGLRDTLKRWYEFYNAYDPLFTWWVADPYKKLDASLNRYGTLVREKIAGVKKDDRDTIVGDPIGRDALLRELAAEMIPYTPEELVALANKEFAWCDAEMLKASRELGYGEDWKRALEHVKTLHVPPGEQPTLIRDMVFEAINFVESRNLVTVPPLARDVWKMSMMSPDRQRINPFFLGGSQIIVSFPTDGMSHEEKQMSMRGNNIHFSRATVHHEVIPGHNLQLYMTSRHRPYRRPFSTPFWTEGWSLYWEMLLWDLGFPQTPENRIGMLFWRMHRCARIIFSLSFHLETMTPQQCVDFLVNRVGHERENAAGEVRRSFETNYSPLYQAAYLLGGLQFRSLHRDLVESRKMTDRQFHDAILKMNSIPVEMVRASLTGAKPAKEFKSNWRFYALP